MTGLPPLLDGFDYLDTLGSGGFADVFLYEQHLPRRRVAVKVLHDDAVDDAAVARFRDEANLMAQLSSHPSIVTIHQAGVTGDGRAYLVMEYCALPDYGRRFRQQSIPVEEALAVGVQLAGAVETAHRAGVLHRDIKPANVLVTDYRRPALADFGIAGTVGTSHAPDAYSVPWAAPETFGDGAVLRPTADVYSLAATVYTLLAGRAPFEVVGGDNTPDALLARAAAGALPPIGRADVPPALEALLATALATSPTARHTSALSFGRALQQAQQQFGLPVTGLDVLDDPFARGTGTPTAAFPATTAPTGAGAVGAGGAAAAGAATAGSAAGSAGGAAAAGAATAGAAAGVAGGAEGTAGASGGATAATTAAATTPLPPEAEAEAPPPTQLYPTAPAAPTAPTTVLPAGAAGAATAPAAPTAPTVAFPPASAPSGAPGAPASATAPPTAPTVAFPPAAAPPGAQGTPGTPSTPGAPASAETLMRSHPAPAASAPAARGGAPLESTVRRPATAPAQAAPVYSAPERRRPRWPGVVLDVVLVLAVAGAAAVLLIGG
ncbi:serine/threonine-protein kinase [Herbiconiux sp. KACC 21604]|uniref:protein kinase domain-containing protein n=1 Tax=unclassified Herbiconiux TaxID=2618217 RepID=UPI001491B7CC|nr:serine/threonine-protein kinase [Herbiconiux sp. SALV-R1]QJU54261.1 serine/threonine protein kinase [Herbiconiux sp. SALV-R1]WPO85328.1 serine/threonine-protein kinase [Herbiconiux sp. KACC 21604]